jgi:L-arabinose isomerase
VEGKIERQAKVGVFGIGLEAYWRQFDGLKWRLEGYHESVQERIDRWATVVPSGLVDTAPKAYAAGERFAEERVDLIFCHAATYATSSQVLPAVREAGVPVVVLNLQPSSSLDYANADTGEWLANCSACCVPEISNAFERAAIPFNVVSGMLHDDEDAWEEIEEWCHAVTAVGTLRGSRFGFLGHTYPGMLDMYSDFTMHQAQLGLHVEVLEMDDLRDRVKIVPEESIAAKLEETRETFEVDESVDEEDLEWSARVSVGLDRLAEDFGLDALAYYYRGTNGSAYERLGAGLILGNSLLTAYGVPASGEGDLKNAVAMKVMDTLGAGGSFTEFYAMDFDEGFILMGHDGPGHIAISDSAPVLRGLGGLPRQGRLRGLRGIRRQDGAGHHLRRDPDPRGQPQDASGRGGVAARTDAEDRQHQQPPQVRAAASRFHERIVRRGTDAPLRPRGGPPRRHAAQGRAPARPRVCRSRTELGKEEGRMPRYAWVLEVRPGYEEEYVRRHREIWPEMVEALRSAGISNYSIFRHGLTLFGYFETDDIEKTRECLANDETNRRWSEWMDPIMKVDIDPTTDFPYLLPLQWHMD